MIYQRSSFERRFKKLTLQQKLAVDNAVVRFQQAVGKPHAHSGLGLRPFCNYLEFRAGLDLRILVLPQEGDFFLVCVGNHNEIRAYIWQNR